CIFRRPVLFVGSLAALLAVLLARPLATRAAPKALPATIEFNRDIRPILSDNCFHCHGPDQARRKAKLRLDTEEGAFADLKDGPVIVRGDRSKGALNQRITADTEKHRMPPASSGRKLSDRQIQLLGRWIEQGAKWQKHWAFLTPKRPSLPAVKNTGWPRNGI